MDHQSFKSYWQIRRSGDEVAIDATIDDNSPPLLTSLSLKVMSS
jgi:hypothetical protein